MPENHGGGIRLVAVAPKETGASDVRFVAYGLDGPLTTMNDAGDTIPVTLDLRLATTEVSGAGDRLVPSLLPTISKLADKALRESYAPRSADIGAPFQIIDELVFYDRLVHSPSKASELANIEDHLRCLQHLGAPGSGVTDSHPAAYTYFGQFVAHDVTHMVWDQAAGTTGAWVNKAGHALDFGTLFHSPNMCCSAPGWSGVAGNWLGASGTMQPATDLPRTAAGIPCTADDRADGNLAVAQMHVLLSRFYRYLVSQAVADAKTVACQHLQAVVLTDYLKRIICEEVYHDVIEKGRTIVAPGPLPSATPFFIPIEFAAACFRFGHSMVRDAYTGWNPSQGYLDLISLFYYTHTGETSDGLFDGRMPDVWLQDWTNFIDYGPTQAPTRSAPIDLGIAHGLYSLPSRLFTGKPGEVVPSDMSLPERTLRRGLGLGLPSAQQLRDVMGQYGLTVKLVQEIAAQKGEPPPQGWSDALLATTPLWLYTLLEAEHQGGAQLGPLAGRVVMETLHAAVENSACSIIKRDRHGKPWIDFQKRIAGGQADTMTLGEVWNVAK